MPTLTAQIAGQPSGPPSEPDLGLYDQTPVQSHTPPATYPNVQPPPHVQHPHVQPNQHVKAKPSWSERLSALGGKAEAFASKMGSETFLPASMDKECGKAARILRSFCEDGIYTDAEHSGPSAGGQTTPKHKALLTIPSSVINRAVGLAIFTTGRVGFHVSGATGSGILISRLPDGSWSPPSGIQVHSIGAGFVIGLDVYDCVIVINTREALEAFTHTRVSLGSDLAVVAGPWGAGGSVDFAVPVPDKRKAAAQPLPHTGPTPPGSSLQRKLSPLRKAASKPVYSYVKSRGFYAGVQIDGTVVNERKEANAAFFGAAVPVHAILHGEVPAGPWQNHANVLFEVLRGATLGQATLAASHPPPVYTGMHGSSVATTTDAMRQTNPSGGLPAQPGMGKAEEAATNGYGALEDPVPPEYEEHQQHAADGGQPPVYADDGQAHPGVGDNKTPRQ